ncbi:MAG: flagellin [Limnohabitans sp.]|jgi:flagellin
MSVINTNVKALYTQAALKTTERGSLKAMQELSTGKRINSAKDDAAGLAIAARMTQQIEGLNQGIRNAGDAIAMIQTTEGATTSITTMLLRCSELAMQAANDTYSDTQRSFLNNEFSQLKQEIDRMSKTHEWNGFKILAGENRLGTAVTPLSLYFQIGDSADQRIKVELPNFGEAGDVTNTLYVSSVADNTDGKSSLKTVAAAQEVIDLVKTSLDKVSKARSMMGAAMNRLEHVVDNLTNVSMNSSASRSQIQDANYATASTALAKSQIMEQAATAVLAQANTSQQTVLKLLG